MPNPYIGNKRKILASIFKEIYDALPYNDIKSLCDLFGGSFVVGTFFREMGKEVYANELLLSSFVNGYALNFATEGFITEEEWKFLLDSRDVQSTDFFVSDKYGDSRFTKREAEYIDAFYTNSARLFGVNSPKFYVANASLMQFIMTHCFVGGRLNSGQVIASLEHRLQHQRNENSEMNFYRMKPLVYNRKGIQPHLYNDDVFDFLKREESSKIDMFYIDPPYGGQQSDYAFMYKFFEEYLARKSFDEIEYLKLASKKFSKAKTYGESFENLLVALPKESYWVLSYNDSSWSDIGTISGMIEKHKKTVVVKEIEYDYKYRASGNTTGVEYLIIGK
jgi:adenine-specific DNA-methyltransferase